MGLSSASSLKVPKIGFHVYSLHLWTVFGLAISNVFLGLSLLFLPSAPRGWSKAFNRDTVHLWLPLVLYCLFLGVSILLSVEPSLSRVEIKELFPLTTLPLAFAWVQSKERVRWVLDGLVLSVAGTALWGLVQLLAGWGDLGHRIRGPFSHYMTFSGVLLMADLVLISQLVCRPVSRVAWRWAALALINAALVSTLTRNAWVALLVAVVVLAIVHAPKALLVFVPAVALAVFLAPATVQQRFVSIFDIRDITNYDRLCMVEAGLQMVKERPIFGLGPEAVRARYPIYRQPTAPRRSVPHLHNSFVHLAAERGLASLGAYLWLMVASLFLAFRLYRRQLAAGGDTADLYLATFLTLLAFNVAGLFEANWRDTELQRIALFMLAVPYLLRSLGDRVPTLPVRE